MMPRRSPAARSGHSPRDADVAGEREFKAAAEARAVDRCDAWLREIRERVLQQKNFVRQRDRLQRRQLAQLADVTLPQQSPGALAG